MMEELCQGSARVLLGVMKGKKGLMKDTEADRNKSLSLDCVAMPADYRVQR